MHAGFNNRLFVSVNMGNVYSIITILVYLYFLPLKSQKGQLPVTCSPRESLKMAFRQPASKACYFFFYLFFCWDHKSIMLIHKEVMAWWVGKRALQYVIIFSYPLTGKLTKVYFHCSCVSFFKKKMASTDFTKLIS